MITAINKHTRILIFLVCIILGFMITMQLKSHNQYQNLAVQRAEDLTVRLKEVPGRPYLGCGKKGNGRTEGPGR